VMFVWYMVDRRGISEVPRGVRRLAERDGREVEMWVRVSKGKYEHNRRKMGRVERSGSLGWVETWIGCLFGIDGFSVADL